MIHPIPNKYSVLDTQSRCPKLSRTKGACIDRNKGAVLSLNCEPHAVNIGYAGRPIALIDTEQTLIFGDAVSLREFDCRR
jgi:hypothetical protein